MGERGILLAVAGADLMDALVSEGAVCLDDDEVDAAVGLSREDDGLVAVGWKEIY